jgi:hypothetical protein
MDTSYKHDVIECMSGWRNLYQPIIDECNAAGVEVRQVKEKFAGLHIEVGSNAPVRIVHAIRYARIHSLSVCEVCGERGQPRGRRQVKTLCETHGIEHITAGLDKYRRGECT